MISKFIINNTIYYLVFKRFLDFFGSLIALLILTPLFLIIALCIKIEDSNGKVIFKHKRIGKNGKSFYCLKFRTMFSNANELKENFTDEQKEEFNKNFKLKNDPRITKVGRVLRKSSLDELPQLINILKGEMSVVGPRPIVREELDYYGVYKEYYKSVKPGLTGLWQVSGRSDISYDYRVNLDVEYIKTRSTLKDIIIILKTFIVVFKCRGSY